MCGRYTLTIPTFEELAQTLGVQASPELAQAYRPRYNIAPTDPSWIVRTKHGTRELLGASFGLVPRWSKSTEGRAKAINARAETIEETPKFRDSFARRRCVVVADGFIEWTTVNGAKKPIRFTPKGGGLLRLAGVYDKWTNPTTGEPMRSFSIVTCPANDLMRPIHDRMPVVLTEEAARTWMAVPDSCEVTEEVRALMRPVPDDFLVATRISSRINSVKNDDPSCILPGDDAEAPPAKPVRASKKKQPTETLGLFDGESAGRATGTRGDVH